MTWTITWHHFDIWLVVTKWARYNTKIEALLKSAYNKLLNFCVKATLQAEDARPTFKWLSERSSSGIQNLAIDFGNERHIVVLHPYNPLSYEVKSSVDPCIFKGTLQMEPTTEVLVTGGCPGADTFEVSSLWFQQKQSRKCFELLFLAFMFRLSLEIGLKA